MTPGVSTLPSLLSAEIAESNVHIHRLWQKDAVNYIDKEFQVGSIETSMYYSNSGTRTVLRETVVVVVVVVVDSKCLYRQLHDSLSSQSIIIHVQPFAYVHREVTINNHCSRPYTTNTFTIPSELM